MAENDGSLFRASADPTRHQILHYLRQRRRVANRIVFPLGKERLALCLGGFLSMVCPEQVALRRHPPGQIGGGK